MLHHKVVIAGEEEESGSTMTHIQACTYTHAVLCNTQTHTHTNTHIKTSAHTNAHSTHLYIYTDTHTHIR